MACCVNFLPMSFVESMTKFIDEGGCCMHMPMTKHFQQRLNQRGITGQMVDCVLQFGCWRGDQCFINRKHANHLIKQWQNLIKRPQQSIKVDLFWQQIKPQQRQQYLACMKKIADKGGVVVIVSDDCLITSYNYTGFRACRGKFDVIKLN